MRIVFAATGGPLAEYPLRALADAHEIAAVLRPAHGPRWRRAARFLRRLGVGGRDEVTAWAAAARVPQVPTRSGSDPRVVEALGRLAPDLLCIASFPWVLHEELLRIARLGVLNVHPSLLPRHRGADPLFWTYYHDDRQAGVSVHLATPQVDAGPVVIQEALPLPRGYPVRRLYLDAARHAAALCVEAVTRVTSGAPLQPQDERAATRAPRVVPGTPMVDFAGWDVERVWHFLSGLYPRFREPLRDERGKRAEYRAVSGFERAAGGPAPGTLERCEGGWWLACRGGRVRLNRAADEEREPT